MKLIDIETVQEGSYFLWYGIYQSDMKSVWLCKMIDLDKSDNSDAVIQKLWGWTSISMYGDPYRVMQYEFEDRFLATNFEEMSRSSVIFDLDPAESMWQNMEQL